MWAPEQRSQNYFGDLACWDVWRDDKNRHREPSPGYRSGDDFFNETLAGTHCGTNWYGGDPTVHGNYWGEPDAPALLGFDWDITNYCHGNCDWAGVNILRLFWPIEYNTCRNFE